MMSGLTNLLPKDRLRVFRRGYFFRLATVGILLIAVLVVLHGVMLIPSYVFLSRQADEQQQQLDSLSNSVGAAEEREISGRLAALGNDTKYLSRLGTVSSASAAVRAVLAVPHAGIALSGITYSPPGAGKEGRMMLTGMAGTREGLRSYQTALAALPFVTNADLPISSFAQESDIPFSITLTGPLKP